MRMLLKDTIAAIHGGAGSLGGAVARAFAREGATVVLSGRTLAGVEAVAAAIRAAGGAAHAAQVDALDSHAVQAHLDDIVRRHGALDIAFNAIGLQDVQDAPLVEMALDDFMRPVLVAMRSHFITATAAGRHMVRQGGGAEPGQVPFPAPWLIRSLRRHRAWPTAPGPVAAPPGDSAAPAAAPAVGWKDRNGVDGPGPPAPATLARSAVGPGRLPRSVTTPSRARTCP
jgi:NAD(P)-dependent dehydrogenase (short-subunit alcohol dehydrogenase family)